MIKYLLPFAVIILFVWMVSGISARNNKPGNEKILFSSHFLFQSEEFENISAADTSEIPEEIKFPSTVGEVVFPHLMHIEDLEIECIECHHQINAIKLKTPHPEYFKSSWINCKICHNGSEKIKQKVYTCSECHHSNPLDVADETLSSKVVVHKNCWECHEVGTGSNASETCDECHAGKKNRN